MKREKKIRILTAIRDETKYSRNNRDMAYLQMNGYIEVTHKQGTSYVNARIRLTHWGWIFLKLEESDKENILKKNKIL